MYFKNQLLLIQLNTLDCLVLLHHPTAEPVTAKGPQSHTKSEAEVESTGSRLARRACPTAQAERRRVPPLGRVTYALGPGVSSCPCSRRHGRILSVHQYRPVKPSGALGEEPAP